MPVDFIHMLIWGIQEEEVQDIEKRRKDLQLHEILARGWKGLWRIQMGKVSFQREKLQFFLKFFANIIHK